MTSKQQVASSNPWLLRVSWRPRARHLTLLTAPNEQAVALDGLLRRRCVSRFGLKPLPNGVDVWCHGLV